MLGCRNAGCLHAAGKHEGRVMCGVSDSHNQDLAWLSGKIAMWFYHKRGKYVIAVVYEIQLNGNVQLNSFQSSCLEACNALCSC